MIESAIEAAVLEEIDTYAGRLEKLIAEMRHDASVFDEVSAATAQPPAG
jgi:hypothetical protein